MPESVLRYEYKHEEAEMRRPALIGYEKQPGKEHVATLTSVDNLVLMLQYQDKYPYEKIEMMYRWALVEKEKKLSKKWPSTLARVNNLTQALSHNRSKMIKPRLCTKEPV